MFVKSIYLKQPNEDLIVKSIDAGLDTIFLSLNGNNTKEELRYYFDEYCDQINMVPLVFYIQSDKKLQLYEQFQSDKKHRGLICPTNVNMIRKLLEFPLDLYVDGLCKSIAINFKNYEEEDYHNPSIENKCICERCQDLTEKEQRFKNIKLLRETLQGIPLYTLSYPNSFLWSISDYWINEYTYNEWNPYKYIHKYLTEQKKQDKKISNISVIRFENIKRSIKSVSNDGYCLYPDDKLDYDKLKEINKKVDKYRNNWWFKFKKGE